MRPTDAQILRAAYLLWAWGALSEFYLRTEFDGDWKVARRYRRGAKRVLHWFEHWFSPEMVERADPDVVNWLMAELAKRIAEEEACLGRKEPELIAKGVVVFQEKPFKLFLHCKEGDYTRAMRLGLWAQEHIGKTLSIYVEDK